MDFKRGLLIGVVVGLVVERVFNNLLWHRRERRPAALLSGGESESPQVQRLMTAEAEVSRLQAELAENRQKLATVEHKLQGAQAKSRGPEQTLAKSPSNLKPTAKPAAKSPKKERSDRLEQIKGIGTVFARRLNEAGINTFEQLAQLSPDRIREIVQAGARQKIEPETWIEEARALGEKDEG
jgi:predicted flap endonuclease-1-like 5' DNA nuclease